MFDDDNYIDSNQEDTEQKTYASIGSASFTGLVPSMYYSTNDDGLLEYHKDSLCMIPPDSANNDEKYPSTEEGPLSAPSEKQGKAKT